jgi:hypothetical protein
VTLLFATFSHFRACARKPTVSHLWQLSALRSTHECHCCSQTDTRVPLLLSDGHKCATAALRPTHVCHYCSQTDTRVPLLLSDRHMCATAALRPTHVCHCCSQTDIRVPLLLSDRRCVPAVPHNAHVEDRLLLLHCLGTPDPFTAQPAFRDHIMTVQIWTDRLLFKTEINSPPRCGNLVDIGKFTALSISFEFLSFSYITLPTPFTCYCGPEYLSRYGDSLQPGQSGDQIHVGARFSTLIKFTQLDRTNCWLDIKNDFWIAAWIWPKHVANMIF